MDGMFNAVLTTTVVAVLLAIVRRWGQHVAGLVSGLPTVTAPALVWLALARGPAFAAEAAAGCIAAGASCAFFGLGYGLASRCARPPAALAAGALLAASPLPLLQHWQLDLGPLVLLSLLASLACKTALRTWPVLLPAGAGGATRVSRTEPHTSPCLTACCAGAVSGAVAMFAGDLGAFWCGVLASTPLIGAAVAVRLHHDEGSAAVTPFVCGYLGGLVGRTCFAALFGLLVAPLGTAAALACASLALGLGLWIDDSR